MENISIAIDGGHSMFKIRAASLASPDERHSFQIPTVVIPSITLTNEQTRQKAELETVEVDGRRYFFKILRCGKAVPKCTQDKTQIGSRVPARCISAGSMAQAMQAFGNPSARVHLVMGLPGCHLSGRATRCATARLC